MKTLSSTNYNEIHSAVRNIVNDIDPLFYSGPEDEYDSYVNNFLRLLKEAQLNENNIEDKLKDIFLGKVRSSSEEERRVEELSAKIKDFLLKE